MTKFCVDCQHYEKDGRSQQCSHPRVVDVGETVLGHRLTQGIDALHVRYNETLCGVDGKWWTERDGQGNSRPD